MRTRYAKCKSCVPDSALMLTSARCDFGSDGQDFYVLPLAEKAIHEASLKREALVSMD